ncbi:ATP-binding protein [Paenibacillus albidus]|uniref:sensor histidine kinase n=1 Tax=Paenibacillus albidus TaxID=2041023 RepID=UPI001BE6F43B|nr:sensor histidine kinase [Paenibacillus albidus]MBT2288372.1 ATP-binding protein [Paenibacillus albidus]
MKLPFHKTASAILVLLMLAVIIPIGFAMEQTGHPGTDVPVWELKREQAEVPDAVTAAAITEWVKVKTQGDIPQAAEGDSAVWVRFPLPELPEQSAVLIDKIYGNHIKAYIHNDLIYDSQGEGNAAGTRVLIPLPASPAGAKLYLWSSGGGNGLGIGGGIHLGSYDKLLAAYVKQDLMDLVLGAALIFMATVLLVCSLFLKRELFTGGFLLVLVILSFGVLVVAYSPFLPLITSGAGKEAELFFDLALFTLLPVFTFYFEKVFGPGFKNSISWFRRFQVGYSLLCLGLFGLNRMLSYSIEDVYRFITTDILGILMILQFIFLLCMSLVYAYRGNTDAVIFFTGFSVFAVLGTVELVLYYTSVHSYHLYWWKWGIVVFVISLIVILGRRFSESHEQVVEYSRELEKFNIDLQHSEKMEIISELAASVAHEVRNPLQVTRGFLQILGERSGDKEKEYLKMAVMELDRASHIITDFLTFAKPGVENVDVLNVSEELKHVAGILVPLANLQGGAIELKIQTDLEVLGSSSKFKQAFINIIKNSIEALGEKGMITITAWKSGNQIIINIKDNGEGMKVSELARLGEPYYSNKTKGTGLGLMVTFRIIEAMKGTIEFESQAGEGTEVVVKLPSAGIK